MTFLRPVLGLFFSLVLALPAAALGLIRDADIEHGLRELARPVLVAAGLSPNNVRILLVNDRNMNAFVVDPQHIFITTGLLARLESSAQLQAVIAHEAAHIANGHFTRRALNVRSARNAATLGFVLAAAAAAASDRPEVGGGIAAGSTQAAQRSLLANTRSDEASADQSSVRYLARAGINPRAASEVLAIFAGQEYLSVGRRDPYSLTHPLSRDRERALAAAAAGAPEYPETQEAAYWFARVQGKLTAFTQAPGWTLRRVRGQTDLISAMRTAIAYHRTPDPGRAIAQIDAVVAASPNDPFLHELRGQILLESREFQAAVSAYGRAAQLAPNNALILGGYGRALLAAGNTAEALRVLERARSRDGQDGRILRDLAVAYARSGQDGMASLATAERFALGGRFADAAIHARRARDQLPRGSGPWQRAEDVLDTSQRLRQE